MPPSVRCPECGAPLPIRSPASILVVCEYCRAAVYWNEEAVLSAGKQSVLPEGFTRLYRGAQGSLSGERFEVLGRARYEFRSGVWDEWYVALGPQRNGWITEDDHELAVQHPVDATYLGDLAGYAPGQRFDAHGMKFEVDEVGETVCVGIEGELPKFVTSGERYRYLDASTLDGHTVLGLELGEKPSAYLGRWLAHEDVRLDDEGDAW
jgi:hypothetical protein